MPASNVDFAYFFDYLVRARGTLLGWIRGQPAVFAQRFPIGLGTIQATLVHIASSEYGYVHRLRGRGHLPEDNPFDYERLPDLEPFLAAWDRQRPATREALAAIGDPNRPVEYITKFFTPPMRVARWPAASPDSSCSTKSITGRKSWRCCATPGFERKIWTTHSSWWNACHSAERTAAAASSWR